MVINSKDGRRIYYTHIPRTGGRYVADLFLHNDYTIDLWSFKLKFYKWEVPHLHYPLNEIYLGINGYDHTMPKFCVTRHPVSRIKSLIKCALITWNAIPDFNGKIEVNSMEDFVRLMERVKTVSVHPKNHSYIVPQSEFIGGCEMWKFENGLGDNFCQWVENLYDFKLPITKPNVDVSQYSENSSLNIQYSENFDQYATLYFEKEINILGYEDYES